MGWNFASELAQLGPHSPTVATVGVAKRYCAHVTKSHYENFSVVSLLLPRRLVPHFHAVYAYCRWADDLADETAGGAESLAHLAWWRTELLACYSGSPRHPVTVALRETIRRFNIPPEPFLNLLVAFEQDQRVKRYHTFEQLLGYCRHSADPVGRLVLHLFECFDEERAVLSDEVCTGLQLANFWQDVSRDYAIGRVYLPAEDRARFGWSESDGCTPAFRELMQFQVERTKGFFDRGSKLLPLLPREARGTVELFVAGGRAILDAIERIDYEVWNMRPEVTKWAKVRLLARAVIGKWMP